MSKIGIYVKNLTLQELELQNRHNSNLVLILTYLISIGLNSEFTLHMYPLFELA